MATWSVVVALLLLADLSAAFTPLSYRRPIVVARHSQSTDEATAAIELGRERLAPYFEYPLDDWQLQAGGEICQGHNVIVCAPTGAGKTVVGEMALHLALEDQQNAIYTTPLKALSNQKFAELRQRFGKQYVGLSTGDMSINRPAKLRVMTTEVYRNMAWRSSGLVQEDMVLEDDDIRLDDELSTNSFVVLDEFHYMGQPGRGGVWEESVITTPSHTQIVGLSATLPNALKLTQWMESVSGRKTVLIEASGGRPVPLRYLFASKRGLYSLFRDEDAGPGAPKGLLGLRGDGLIDTKSMKRSKKKGNDDDGFPSDLPTGLQINPILKAAAQKRRMRVENAIERKKNEQEDIIEFDDVTGRKSRRKSSWPRQRRLSPRGERREREQLLKREMRKEVPSLSTLIKRLDQKNLLPAILFIFSRAGCDNSAQQVCQQFMGPLRDPFNDDDDEFVGELDKKKKSKGRSRGKKNKERMLKDDDGRVFRRGSAAAYVEDDKFASLLDGAFDDDMEDLNFDDSSPLNVDNLQFFASAGLLRYDQVKEVAGRVAAFNDANEEIQFDEENIEQFLFGVGAHHAGMLPAHKAFVETLYRAQLMKVVFATETLAAGINMPARTTCICALAKRGDNAAMNLLETSNLLQMAGRAGRRGMDTDGTCVILSTPFENEDNAASILTSEIKPITSQFAPSYSLAVNLIARGQGKVEVARKLVEKSFAMWEKRHVVAETRSDFAAVETSESDGVVELLTAAAHERFISTLVEVFGDIIDSGAIDFDLEQLKLASELLQDRKLLKAASKGYVGATRTLNVETITLQHLQGERNSIGDTGGEGMAQDLEEQVQVQQSRVLQAETKVSQHSFTSIAEEASRLISGNYPAGELLATELGRIRKGTSSSTALTGEDLVDFAKSVITIKKKQNRTGNSGALIQAKDQHVSLGRDPTWSDMLALTKVLICYGCLKSDWKLGDSNDDLESSSFSVTSSGQHVGTLSFENSLWNLVAMGGLYDVVGASSELDKFRLQMSQFENDLNLLNDDQEMNDIIDDLFAPREPKEAEASPTSSIQIAQEESEVLSSCLAELTPRELAGYVSCLVSDSYRRGSQQDVGECFKQLTPKQQKAVQSSLSVCERLLEVQKVCGTGSTNTRAELDLTKAQVVTAWAAGCTWSEALEMNKSAPGDLVRMLGRVMDALRQIGNLSSAVIRKDDMDKDGMFRTGRGISMDVRNLCRDAARAMNRYPVKDPLPFDTDSSEVDDDFEDDDTAAAELEDGEGVTETGGEETDVEESNAPDD